MIITTFTVSNNQSFLGNNTRIKGLNFSKLGRTKLLEYDTPSPSKLYLLDNVITI